jgi:hypothetical protein
MAMLLRFPQVPGSNSDPGTEYSERFRCFSKFLLASAETVPHNRLSTFLTHYSLTILSIDTIYFEVLTVSLNHTLLCTLRGVLIAF